MTLMLKDLPAAESGSLGDGEALPLLQPNTLDVPLPLTLGLGLALCALTVALVKPLESSAFGSIYCSTEV